MISIFLFLLSYARGLNKKSVGFLLENGFFLDNATLEQLAPVYRLVRDRLTEACDDCFSDAYDFNDQLKCNAPCAIGETVTLEKLAQVYKDVHTRFEHECENCYFGRDSGEKQFFCEPCEALAYPPAVSDYEWSLSFRIWLDQLPLATKMRAAEFLARQLFTADNSFYHVNERRCVESMKYCERTYMLGDRPEILDLRAQVKQLEEEIKEADAQADAALYILNQHEIKI